MILSRRSFLGTGTAAAGAALVPALARPQTVRLSADPFSLGVASGYPDETSLVLWTRLVPEPFAPDGGMPAVPVAVDWELAADERFAAVVARGSAIAEPELAHSVRVEVGGLAPDRRYWYRFRGAGAESPVGRSRTAPAAGADVAGARFGVASCQHYESGHYAAFRAMADEDLDLIIHVGDYIYENAGVSRVRAHSLPDAVTLADYRQRYALYKSDPSLKAAHAAAPWIVTWDDHEVDNDYAAAFSEDDQDVDAFLARRAAAYQAYFEHQPMPMRMRPAGGAPIYTRQAFGGLVDVYVLDGRRYRSRQACSYGLAEPCAELETPGRTMLGAAQEAWLTDSLAARRPRFTLIAQQTVFAAMDQRPGPGIGYWTDGWSGYPAARARLIDCFTDRRVPNPVILSGDLHAWLVNDVHGTPGDIDSAVVATELVTTSISSGGPPQARVDGWRAENPNVRFANSERRGYTRLTVTRDRLDAELVAVDDVADPASDTSVLGAWHVLDGRPGALP